MAKIIVGAGDKGGSGKTTTTHAVCHGLGMHGVRSIHVTTDPRRVVLPADTRRYATVDGRDIKVLSQIIDKLSSRNDCVLVIDGGGGRPEIDKILDKVSDLTLIPFLHSAEDLRVVASDLERLGDAVGLPNRWPTQKWARDVADRDLARYLGSFRPRLMSPVPEVNGYTTLLTEEGPAQRVNGSCKQLALRVLERMGLSLFDFNEKPNAAAPEQTAFAL